MKTFEVALLVLGILGLHQSEQGIVLGDDRRTQIVLSLKRLMSQYSHRQRHDLITLGRIKVGSLKDAITHEFQSSIPGRHRIHSRKLIVASKSPITNHLIGSPTHSVVVREDIVEVTSLVEDALHRLLATLLLPVASLRSHHLHTRKFLHGFHETTMTLQGR